ncbi:unnamed protein product [Arabidopsis thaliana]|uniref:(thale cress) hypothetical protein n=1 Tax=Arabidopsis thaliana TaxID=3702 RepID=A0A7G2EQB8_ARATH|nr:unnamed protein product [Arabidopsis thaliana]
MNFILSTNFFPIDLPLALPNLQTPQSVEFVMLYSQPNPKTSSSFKMLMPKRDPTLKVEDTNQFGFLYRVVVGGLEDDNSCASSK